jgi:hypothetical protein
MMTRRAFRSEDPLGIVELNKCEDILVLAAGWLEVRLVLRLTVKFNEWSEA